MSSYYRHWWCIPSHHDWGKKWSVKLVLQLSLGPTQGSVSQCMLDQKESQLNQEIPRVDTRSYLTWSHCVCFFVKSLWPTIMNLGKRNRLSTRQFRWVQVKCWRYWCGVQVTQGCYIASQVGVSYPKRTIEMSEGIFGRWPSPQSIVNHPALQTVYLSFVQGGCSNESTHFVSHDVFPNQMKMNLENPQIHWAAKASLLSWTTARNLVGCFVQDHIQSYTCHILL